MILDGTAVSAALKADIAGKVKEYAGRFGRAPHLAVVLVGDDPASKVYVASKEKACGVVGFRSSTLRLPADTRQDDLLKEIARLNGDAGVDGILVQLPLPAGLD